MYGRIRKIVSFCVAVAMCVCFLGECVYAKEYISLEQRNSEDIVNDISGTDIDDAISNGSQDGWDRVATESVYEDGRCRITFSLISCWDEGYNGNIKIENLSDDILENWYVKFDFENSISSIWNAEVAEHAEENYVIKNAGWNRNIPVGDSVEFGFSGLESFLGFPEDCRLLGSVIESEEENYSVEYYVEDDWETGFTGRITITNRTEKCIEDWRLEFDFDCEISRVWDCEIASHEGSHYVIHNSGYNADIESGESISFGFVVSEGSSQETISNILLYNHLADDIKTEDKPIEETPIREKEPLQSIGEAYYKAPSVADVIYNEETGILHVKNQVLLSAYMGVDKSIIEEITNELNAQIVGYIELTNDYQLEFVEDKSAEELDNILEYLNSFSFISYASLNVANEQIPTITQTNDTIYCNDPTDNWDESMPKGDNWGLEALRILSVWDNKDTFQPVKVGVYDNMFSEHEDLIFDDIVNNPSTIDDTHGTHVAGIIAAQHNNGKGIAGVATDVRLYGYAYAGSGYGSSMGDKIAYATLIGNQVRVVNVSAGLPEEIQYAASHDSEKAKNYIRTSADILAEYLNKLTIAGYDFLIVTSAGNAEDKKFVKDTSTKYGYRYYHEINDKGKTICRGSVQAYYNCALTAIEAPNIKNRIIVVGGVIHFEYVNEVKYRYSNFSNVGNRVDICAPGVGIWSTVPAHIDAYGYAMGKGTSVATPYVAGIAALMYQANPSLDAVKVKEIICSSGLLSVSEAPKQVKFMPDALYCYTEARNYRGSGNSSVDYPQGILMGYMKNMSNEPVANVMVTALKKDTGEYNLGKYSFLFQSDEDGYYMQVLPQGMYDLVISAEGYLPYCVHDVEILPDHTKYMENMVLSKWYSVGYNSVGVSGIVTDALKGTAVANASVKLRKGWNNTTGAYIKNIFGEERISRTDNTGKFAMATQLGCYTAEIVKEGYITEYYNIVAGDVGEKAALTQNAMVLVPVLPDDEYRIVLTWGDKPKDLDAHLTYYVNDVKKFHIQCSNRWCVLDGLGEVTLDRDDMNGYGPETITISFKNSVLATGYFKYSVYNCSSSSGTLAASGATVRVYKGNLLWEKLHVPFDGSGTVWHVFDLNNSGIKIENDFYYAYSQEIR